MMKKIKGQGALEYLLLIGGAVLIAVIVIALLVGMGGQSRDTAINQATKAQQALDQPQAPSIVSIVPGVCAATGAITVNWSKIGEGGTYRLHVYDYSGTEIGPGYDVTDENSSFDLAGMVLGGKACQDTFWASIETTKNNQTVSSARMNWNWD